MTSNTAAARNPQPADIARVKQLLREAAFVLRMTRRVKADILRNRPQPKPSSASAPETAPATLLV